MAAKFKKMFDEMIENNKALFIEFKILNDNFERDPNKFRNQFNETGAKVMDIIREREAILCMSSEGAGFGKYTSNLSEKFWGEIRKNFSRIDEIGVE